MVLNIVCAKHAPAFVRAALSKIRELDAVRDNLILVASELVTNAVKHSGGSPADTIQVRAVLRRGNVLISVNDPGLSNDTPRMRHADVARASGHGLRIVNQLARRWGVERDRGHRVWAEPATGRGGCTGSEQDLVRGPGQRGPLPSEGALQAASAG
jgi:anti-sigma regulatory factor (Ser/Thr protein kinase)